MSQGICLRGVVALDGFAFVLRSRPVLDDGVVLDVEPARTRSANPDLPSDPVIPETGCSSYDPSMLTKQPTLEDAPNCHRVDARDALDHQPAQENATMGPG